MAGLKGIADGTLGSNPDEMEPAVIQALSSDDNAVVRHEAAFVLSLLKDQGRIPGDAAQQALVMAAHDKSILVRHEVALALASFPSPLTAKLLVALTHDESEDVIASAEFALNDLFA
jgi:HEAT repeat protein